MRWLVLALLLVGCGRKHWSGGDPALFGVVLEIRPDAAAWFDEHPHGRERIGLLLKESARFFGRSTSEYDGLKLVVQFGETPCGPGFIGCENTTENTITVQAREVYVCIEQLSVQHETLHLFIEDHDHKSPLWEDLKKLIADSYRVCPHAIPNL
jgi:hypothetical protein